MCSPNRVPVLPFQGASQVQTRVLLWNATIGHSPAAEAVFQTECGQEAIDNLYFGGYLMPKMQFVSVVSQPLLCS